MKISFYTFIQLLYYFKVFRLMRAFRPHITDKLAVELFEYWEVVYNRKIVNLLNDKNKKMFS